MKVLSTLFILILGISVTVPTNVPTIQPNINNYVHDISEIEKGGRFKRGILAGMKYKWSFPIKYTPLNAGPFFNQNGVDKALQEISKHTCITFEKVDSISNEPGLKEIFKGPCSSIVGKASESGPQNIHLHIGCDDMAATHHEFGHALGLVHEHMRWDRDDYVKVLSDNIGSTLPGNFNKYGKGKLELFNISYDYGSQMHYFRGSHGSGGKNTIEPLDKNYLMTIGQALGFQYNDYKKLNLYYCDECGKSYNEKVGQCQRNGYLNPKNCSECMCPAHYTGEYCQDYKKSESGCGQDYLVYNATDELQTIRGEGYLNCYYYINTDEDHKIEITFKDSNLHTHQWCPNKQALEIRYRADPSVMGAMFCGKQKGTNMVSESNEVSMNYRGTSTSHWFELEFRRVEK
uniref:Metalloendopeptidase n=1 Tax=Parastrongyloides trichosuri TaxID=131310 RepID=A0A0N4ZD36_PARTI